MARRNASVALIAGALLIPGLGGCAAWLPDTATRENHALLYQEFYEAHLNEDDDRADALARRLELCGRQVFVRNRGFMVALQQQQEHGAEATLAEVVDLFTTDACSRPKALPGAVAGKAPLSP